MAVYKENFGDVLVEDSLETMDLEEARRLLHRMVEKVYSQP